MGTRTLVIQRQRGVSLGRVATVGIGQCLGIDCRLGLPHPPGRLQSTDGVALRYSYQPEAGGHRGPVVEKGGIADDDRAPGRATHHHFERRSGFAAEQVTHGLEIGPEHVVQVWWLRCG
jgi:hypothetical protein